MNKVVEMKSSQRGSGSARTILTCKEFLTSHNAKELESMFNEAMEKQKSEIILDCEAMSFVDSAGLELLVAMDEKLKKRGGVLKMVAPNAVCNDILVATRLKNLFHVYADIHEAIQSGV